MSSSNSAFNLQGAIKANPKAINPLTLGASLGTGNPVNNALNSMQTGGQNAPIVKAPPQIPTAPTNQSVTSHTVSADGTVKQTYSPPQTNITSPGVLNTTSQTSAPINTQSTNTSVPPVNTSPPTGTTYSGFLGDLKSAATDTSAVDKANADLESLRKEYAQATGNIEGGGYLPLQFVQGREQVLNRQYSAEEAAAESALTNALTARGQNITGLGTVAGLAQPTQVPYNNQYIDPTTGKPVNPSVGGDMTSAVALQAEKVKNGTASPQDAANALSAYGQAGTNALQQALGSNFSIPQARGISSATETNAQTGGTASVDANNKIYQDALANSANLQQQLGNVDQLGNLLLTTAQAGGINPSSSQFANQSIAQVRSQLSNAQQAQFDSTMNTLTAKIGLLLNVGGGAVTDQVRNSANQVLSGTLALSALPAVLNQIQSEGAIVAQNQRDVATKAYQNVQQGNLGNSGGASGSNDPLGIR